MKSTTDSSFQGRRTAGTPLVLAGNLTGPKVLAEIAEGRRPRLDYLMIADALGADVLDTSASLDLPSWRRKVERVLASDVEQSRVALRQRGTVSAWLSTSEKVGLPLALRTLAWQTRSESRAIPHVMIAHNLQSPRKRLLHRLTGVLRKGFDTIICLTRSQENYLCDVVGLPAERVQRVYDSIDQQFFRPGSGDPADGEYLLAVGRENRDYRTLVEAARTTGLPLIIVSSSLWSSRALGIDPQDLPDNVTIRQDFVSYTELRALYEGARLVVVPLSESDYAAGVNGVLEAMAMGKATVVSRTQGLEEYVREGETNRLVAVGDAAGMAASIRSLWDDAQTRREMGHAARLRVEREMSLDGYAARVADIVQTAIRKDTRS